MIQVLEVDCSNTGLGATISAMKNILNLIHIIVPILLMIALSIHIMQLTKNPEDEKRKKKVIVSSVAAAIVFFVPMFINLVMNIVGDSTTFSACWNNASNPGAATDYADPYNGRKKVIIIPNPEDYEKGTPKSSSSSGSSYAGGGVIDGSCYGEYENGKGLAKIYVDTSKVNGTNYKIINAGKIVQEGTSTTYQSSNIYELLIHPSIEVQLTDGGTKKAECEIKHSAPNLPYYKDGYYFSKGAKRDTANRTNNPYPSNGISYYIYVPKEFNPNTKYPLVLALHGGYGWGVPCNGETTSEGNQTYHYLKTALLKNSKPINHVNSADVNAIVIAPSNMTCGWEGSIYKALDIMHTYIKLYNVDVDSVVVTGTSQGGYGTLYAGFLEEQIIYKATDNNTTLESVAKMYNTTAEEVKKYNKKLNMNISYSDKGTRLKSGSHTIIKARNEEGMRGIFSVLVPMSPAKNLSRCIFTPSTIYDKEGKCKKTPPYTMKTPIWVISSNDEYGKIQQFAKELTAYYEQNGDIRYTVLSNIKKYYKTNAHNTQIPMFGYTNTFDWMISQKYGNVKVRNNSELDNIERQLGQAFVKDFHP